MKTIENVTLYKCDFCKKELKRKHAMTNHEIRCNCNPINQRPCLDGCIYAELKEIQYEAGFDDYNTGEPVMKTGTTFFCSLKKQLMLHPKLEYRENGKYLKNVYQNDEEVEQDWMPKECSSYEIGF